MVVAWYKKHIVVEMYYCKACGGVMDTPTHAGPHFKDNQHYGYMVLHEAETNRVFVMPIYCDDDVTVEQGLQGYSFADDLGWLYVGSSHALYDLACKGMDLRRTSHRLQPHDNAFKELNMLHARYIDWYLMRSDHTLSC